MAYTTLLFERRDGIATITVNRPDKLNALNSTVIGELGIAIEAAAQDPEVRAVILTGAGAKSFVAGADISEIAEQGPLDARSRSSQGASSVSSVRSAPQACPRSRKWILPRRWVRTGDGLSHEDRE